MEEGSSRRRLARNHHGRTRLMGVGGRRGGGKMGGRQEEVQNRQWDGAMRGGGKEKGKRKKKRTRKQLYTVVPLAPRCCFLVLNNKPRRELREGRGSAKFTEISRPRMLAL